MKTEEQIESQIKLVQAYAQKAREQALVADNVMATVDKMTQAKYFDAAAKYLQWVLDK